LGESSSKAWSTAANATVALEAGLPSGRATRMFTVAVSRTRYDGFSGATSTRSWSFTSDTCTSATPCLKAGLARSMNGVGAAYPWSLLRNALYHWVGRCQPQEKKECQEVWRSLPRKASTDTYTLGPHSGRMPRRMVG